MHCTTKSGIYTKQKKGFDTERQAVKAMDNLYIRLRGSLKNELNVYKCSICNKFHIGRKKDEIKNNPVMELNEFHLNNPRCKGFKIDGDSTVYARTEPSNSEHCIFCVTITGQRKLEFKTAKITVLSI